MMVYLCALKKSFQPSIHFLMKIFPNHAFLVGIEFSETKKNIFEDNMDMNTL